jgi:hypothetical protein
MKTNSSLAKYFPARRHYSLSDVDECLSLFVYKFRLAASNKFHKRCEKKRAHLKSAQCSKYKVYFLQLISGFKTREKYLRRNRVLHICTPVYKNITVTNNTYTKIEL